ncbi:hypothetical protein CR513_05695, partial [Mucuna pruriens]
MSNLAAKLKSLKRINDLSVNLYLTVCKRKRGCIDESAHFASTSQNKKRKNIKDVAEGYDGSREQRLGPFALFLRECGIVPQYTMSDKPSMNGVAKRRNRTFKDMSFFIAKVTLGRSIKVILEEVEFEKEENIRNVFEEDSINDIGQVLVPITIQETTPIIGDNVQTIVPDIVPEQDYNKRNLNNHKVSLRRSIRDRRHSIPDDYIVFLQEHEDNIGLTEDDHINFCQAMQSSNSQKCIDAMKDELKSMQDNDVWDLVELPECVKPIGCK